MPLFDSLEREVSSFFVAQGSIFDTILKTMLERLAHVESRVDASVHTINNLALSINQATSNGADETPTACGGGETAAASAGGTATASGGGETVAAVSGDSYNAELEYFVMTLARQLNIVLALLFQPYTHDAIAQSHERQQEMPSISHVLTDNESILTRFAISPPVSTNESGDAEFPQIPSVSPRASFHHDHLKTGQATAPEIPLQITTADHDPNPVDVIATDADTDANTEMTDDVHCEVGQSSPAVSSHLEGGSQHHNSTFTMIHQLHSVEDRRRHHERELMQRMERLLHESQASCQTQCQALHAQNNALLLELQQQHEKLSSEWSYHQEKQASFDLLFAQLQDQQQKELDKQLLTLSNTFLTSQTTQEQQISRILDHLREFSDRYVSKADMDQLLASWLQAARDDCVYGADVESLTRLQHDLVDLQQMLERETPSPALNRLSEEVAKVLELTERILGMLEEDNAALHGTAGNDMMQSLRHMVGQLEDLAHDAMADSTMPHHALAFLTGITRQMELGTASLLEALERQQEGYQQALSQQHAELEMLKLDMHAQKLSDEELRKQLMACPNQDDTMQLVNALKEQIHASTSDSASRMLDTVDDLRNTMAGLPTHDFLQELLHSKADQSEIDRLRVLLASQAATGAGGPALAKSPTRCLSCDQSLPFMQSRPNSAAACNQHEQSDRPSSAGSSSPSRPASAHGSSSPSRPASAHGSSSPSRPTSAHGSSPTRHQLMAALPFSHTSDVEEHEHAHEHDRMRFVSPFTRAMFLVSEHGMPSTQEILRDLAKTIEATKRRRLRMLNQRDTQLAALDEDRTLLSFAALPSSPGLRKSVGILGTPEDRKNKIPLRRPTLSDQVVYGPSITSGFMKPRKSTVSSGAKLTIGSAQRDKDESKSPRSKNAVMNERRVAGGAVIMRAPSTTVVIRPFSEIRNRDEPAGRRNTRAN